MNIFLVSFLVFFLTLFLFRLIIPVMKKFVLYKPNKRSSHNFPKPSGGGIIFVIISVIFCSFFKFWIPLICLPLAILGFIDDIGHVPSSIRYLTQLIVSFLLLNNTTVFENFSYETSFLNFFFIKTFLIIFSTAIINFINFMDGIDGLVASCMGIIFLIISIFSNQLLLFLVAPLLGFLYFNWFPSKIFMGDVGSTYLGALFVGCLFNIQGFVNQLSIILVALPLLLDPFICVLRRIKNRDAIFLPHKLHLYQRLHQNGMSHGKVSIIYLCVTIILGFTFLYLSMPYLILLSILVFFLGVYLEQRYAIPFDNS